MNKDLNIKWNDQREAFQAFAGDMPLQIEGQDKEVVLDVAYDFYDEIQQQLEDEQNNYGLLFYACGYDGDKQARIGSEVADRGVRIF